MSEQVARKRKSLVGLVRATKMTKTITVDVLRLEKHPKYHKFMRRRSSYLVHDENGDANVGDQVRISETRPISKQKRWRLLEIVQRARTADVVIPTTEDAPVLASEDAAGAADDASTDGGEA